MTEQVQADYLVVGSGAMAMAFADVLLRESDASVIMVDRHHQPGGHWNDAYPYVRLHQPSAFYGVNSKKLGSDVVDASGWNKGLYELASGSEVLAYFDQVMQQSMIPGGRLQYFPMCEYEGDGHFSSLLSNTEYFATTTKVVDATYMNVLVPSMRPPPYEVAEGISCVAPNELAGAASEFDRYMVIGAGKTGMDACLFLLRNSVDPARISWVMPRDSWLLNRASIQPGALFVESVGQFFMQQLQATAEARSVEDLFTRLAESRQLIRFNDEIWPTMYRCATVTEAELDQLRRIQDVVRQGHVQRIDQHKVYLDQGDIETSSKTLHIDCSADGLQRRPATAVFSGSSITLQALRTCQQVFSAAFIGHVEAAYDSETAKNTLTTSVPHPDSEIDFLRTSVVNLKNTMRWAEDPELQAWLQDARLDAFSQPGLAEILTPEARAVIAAASQVSIDNLQRLLTDHDGG